MRTIGKDTILDLQMDWMDDRSLREKAREAIQNGKLPTRSPDRILGGPGCGEACALCGETLQRNRMELEAEFRVEGEIHELHKYHLHQVASRRGSSNAPIAGKAQSIQPRRPPLELMKFAKPERYAILHLV